MEDLSHSSLLILDGAFFAHRSFHARHMSPRAAFIQLLLGVVGEERPEYLVCAWDASGPNYRHALFPAYKSNRPEKDPLLVAHLQDCVEVLQALQIPVFACAGFEGDDVVATIRRQWLVAGGRVVIHTADKDILQLVDASTRVVVGGRRFTDDLLVESHMGVRPSQIAEFLALAGDSADGIPGIPGIGLQTAARLLQAFGSLDALIAAAPSTSDRRLRGLVGQESQLRLYHRLTVLSEDAPLLFEPVDLICRLHPQNVVSASVPGLWPLVQQHCWPLDVYRERSFAFLERWSFLAEEMRSVPEGIRVACRAAARVPFELG